MINTWFIADTHFRHSNILEFENRPYSSLEEMEVKMIEAWNNVVGKNDIVYIVGDFCFGGHVAWIEILDQLKGNIILIKGNHDKTKIIKRVYNEGYLREIHNVGELIKIEKFLLNITHYPLEIGERVFNFNISGHIHSEPSKAINQINVGVDSDFMAKYYKESNVPFGSPVSIGYIMGELQARNVVMQSLRG